MKLTPPNEDELEVSVFGPGRGEALAIHIGKGIWILIDSCIFPKSDVSASLQYLQNIGVNLNENVKLIVITHWHDDHIKGISSLVEQCKNSRVFISGALRSKEFGALIGLRSGTLPTADTGISEFAQIYSIIASDKHRAKLSRAQADTVLFNENLSFEELNIAATIWSLSPTDEAVLRAQLAFVTQLQTDVSKRISDIGSNDVSIAILISVGSNHLLLGADLEASKHDGLGWVAILDNSALLLPKSDFVKLPHHGAKSGHEERVWSEMLQQNPFAATTPFSPSRLPTIDDVVRTNQLTNHGYITARPRRKKPDLQDTFVANMLKEISADVRVTIPEWGHLRFRKPIISKESARWTVEMFGGACKLTSLIDDL